MGMVVRTGGFTMITRYVDCFLMLGFKGRSCLGTDILPVSGRTGVVVKMAGVDGQGDGNGTATPSWSRSTATMTKTQEHQRQKMRIQKDYLTHQH